ncbi:hypothetical protein AK812_SmicGene20982 [Symbiodinium microadriaticum]|uniref:Uncharacterized protein n=1 Tax=Symbiodinium microadriaticum TaxID=2951 RepID=A0A1Q9DNN4_SYMMI|nr:hypothetical protein AK812_SmicGene20982 [Symbiodinium microadriaticum]
MSRIASANLKKMRIACAQVYVPDEIKALPAEAPILKSRRLRDPDGELLLPLKTAKKGKAKKKAVGFNTPRAKK